MPIQFCYNRSENFAISKSDGVLTLQELLSVYDDIERSQVESGYRSIADHRFADFSNISNNNILIAKTRANEVIGKLGGNYRFAMIAGSSLEFGLGRMFEMMDESPLFNVRVFLDLDKALEWLEISHETVERIATEGGITWSADNNHRRTPNESN